MACATCGVPLNAIIGTMYCCRSLFAWVGCCGLNASVNRGGGGDVCGVFPGTIALPVLAQHMHKFRVQLSRGRVICGSVRCPSIRRLFLDGLLVENAFITAWLYGCLALFWMFCRAACDTLDVVLYNTKGQEEGVQAGGWSRHAMKPRATKYTYMSIPLLFLSFAPLAPILSTTTS